MTEAARSTSAPSRLRDRSRPVGRDDWRLVLVMLVFLAAYGVVAGRMALTALGDPSEPAIRADSGGPMPVRAPITDRHGELMAANLPAWALYADPREIRDPAAAADALAPIFPQLSRDALHERLSAERKFVWVARPVTPAQKAAVMDLRPAIPGLKFGRREMRIYPRERLAAHVLGGVRAESERVNTAALIGQAGLEGHFDEQLRDPGRAGQPLRLSIDLGAQAALTDILAAGMRRTRAQAAAAVMMDVRTGELLAIVSLPDFDPNAPVKRIRGGAANPRFNRAVSGVYELGSVFKPITAAIALELGLVGPETMIETGSPVVLGRNRIRDLHRMPATMSVTDVIRRSSNTGAARLARAIGRTRLRDHLDALGMLTPLEMEVVEARSGRPMLPPRWGELSTLTIGFGHGLAVSPMHLASAYATIANGGRLVSPSLVKGGRAPGQRIFSERTSREMLRMLRTVVARGTGRRTNVPGYEVGGKTGTADKARPGGGYYRDRVLASFAGVFPVSDPAYAIVVMLDEPTDPESGKREASRTAVPVVAQAIRRIAPMIGLRPLPDPMLEPTPVALGTAPVTPVGGRP
ncbi:MAG: penicillin-binding protein 2 [Pseudomonadota bacterium]